MQLNLDAGPIPWRNTPQTHAPIFRENSYLVPQSSRDFLLPAVSAADADPGYTEKRLPENGRRTYRTARVGTPQGRNRVVEVMDGSVVGSGQCVAYARTSGVLLSGNAKYWPQLAKNAGYLVDNTPEIGAIIVTGESSAGTSTGHVTGPIEQIDGDWMYISEQNYVSRTVTKGWIHISLALAIIHPKDADQPS